VQPAAETIENQSTLAYQSVLRMVQPALMDEALAETATAELAVETTEASTALYNASGVPGRRNPWYRG